MIGCSLSLSSLFPNQLSTTTLSRGPASWRRNLLIKQRIILIPPCAALTSVNTLGAACPWTRRELSLSMPPARAWSGCVNVWMRTKWNASPERWTCSAPHTKPVKQAVFFLPHAETPRRWCSNMSGNHYKGQEVSCCIKYFIFGFNILFWVRWLYFFWG